MSVIVNGYEVAKSTSSYGRWVMFDRNQHWFFQSKAEAMAFAAYCPRLTQHPSGLPAIRPTGRAPPVKDDD